MLIYLDMNKTLLYAMSLIALISWQTVRAADVVTIDIPDEASFAKWTVIDANASSSPNTWTYNDGDAVYTQDTKNAANDWLISPAVTLVGGQEYKLTAYVKNGSTFSSDKHNFDITVGAAATIEGQTTTILSVTSFTTKTYTANHGTFTPPTDGEYYFAIHEKSSSYQGDFYFQKFELQAKVAPKYTIPYSESFSSSDKFDEFTLLNPLNETKTWTYYSSKGYAQYWGGTAPVDQWLVTPALIMEAGKSYKLTFKTGLESGGSSNYKDLYVYLGNAATTEALNRQLFYENIQSAIMTEKSAYLSVPESGDWYIGFRCYGNTSYNAVFLDDIVVEEVVSLPGEVTDLSAVAGADGAMMVNVNFKLPTIDMAGNMLAEDALLGYEIYRGEEKISEGSSCAPGSAIAFVDNVTETGKYTYSVRVSLSDNWNNKATVESGWVGVDTPQAPANVTLSDVDGKPQISFSPITSEGVNGGYVDASKARYTVVRDNDNLVVAADTEDTTMIDNTKLSLANYSYSVYAKVGDMQSAAAQSNKLVFGDALQVPFSIDLSTDDASLWTTLDADANGSGWAYNSNSGYYANTSMSKPKNDYLFTPPFETIESKLKLTYTVKGYNYRYSDEYKVVLATATDADAAGAAEVIEAVDANGVNSSMMSARTVEFTTLKAGKFYIGFNDVSTDPWGLYIGSVKMEMIEDLSGVASMSSEESIVYNRSDDAIVVTAPALMTVYSMTGALQTVDNVDSSLSVSSLDRGVYVVKAVFVDGKVKTLKFVK